MKSRRFENRFIPIVLTEVLLVGAAAVPGRAAVTDVTVNGTSGPWLWQDGGLNSSYSYGADDQISPTIITSASGISVVPSQQLTITYLSGTVSTAAGRTPTDAEGDPTLPANNSDAGPPDGVAPSYYMPAADYPINFGELVGTFADSSGDIEGIAFPIGLSATVTVPSGASQLQLGVNDNKYSDNSGYFDVQVSDSAVPEPASLSLLALGVLGLMARRRRTGLGTSIVRA